MSLHKLRLHLLAFDQVRTPLSLHFLCSKFSIFLTTYPPLNANVICEGSLSGITSGISFFHALRDNHFNIGPYYFVTALVESMLMQGTPSH